MTEATKIRPSSSLSTKPTISYQVAMPEPETHLFAVTLQVHNFQAPILDLKMPVWTPGSYLVREYAKHLQDFSAQNHENKSLPWQKVSKNHWQIQTQGNAKVVVRYRIFANELTVRTNHLDSTHGYFNGSALFFDIPGLEKNPIQIKIVPPQPGWRVTTPLSSLGEANTFFAPDFDTLVDSPFEIGKHNLYNFEVLGKPHELVIWGQGNLEPKRAIADIQKIIQVESEMFGGLPYNRYVFLLHLSAQGYGGLEHKDSCTLNYPRFGFRAKDQYERFMQLVAHEFFHLWNVKRIRPKELEVFNYNGENYTTSLWFCEGTTSYYDLVFPLRAGIYDGKTFFNLLSKEITRLQTTPGRLVQPLSESSWDTWIKLYRPDANSNNSQISYYLKGELVSVLLDLLIRYRQENQRSLDQVMQKMWQEFGQTERGFTPTQLQNAIESVAGINLDDFFARYIHGTEELPFNEYLEPYGLQLEQDHPSELAPYLGINVKTENGREIIKFVESGSPAQRAGIDPGDELLAINGIRVSAENLSDRLKDYQSGDQIKIALFHQDELRHYHVTLTTSSPKTWKIVPVTQPNPTQKTRFLGWLGTPLTKVFNLEI